MATMFLKSTDSGAPTLNGVNGSLCAVLDWALVQNGWAIEYTATNARVYRAGSGNRRRLAVRHDSAVSGDARKATVRNCESATSATAYVDPSPTVAQVPNNTSTWTTSNVASSSARPWEIILTPTCFYLIVTTENTVGRCIYFYGDVPPTDSGDVWNTLISVDSNSAPDMSYGPFWQQFGLFIQCVVPCTFYWSRNIDGAVKSIPACLVAGSALAYAGNIASCPVSRQGYNSKIHQEKLAVGCPGAQATISATKSILRRGWLPNLWVGLHNGRGATGNLTTDKDTFTNTAYNASATFEILDCYSTFAINYPWFIFEKTDTWVAPT